MRPMRIAAALAAALMLASCAARRSGGGGPENDPLEGMNRKIFWFNGKVDAYVLEPVAIGWDKVAPDPVQRSVSHFFWNLRFPIIATNDLLQGKLKDSAIDVGRFAVNTTVGVAGFLDPATGWGLPQHYEDFGQTLGRWGVPAGPYLVLPLLGPSNPRDATGLGVDTALSVTPFFVDWYYLLGARLIDIVNERSLVLTEVRNAKEASFDYYTFVRNAYAQRRHAQVNDEAEGAPREYEDLYSVEPTR